MAKKANFHQKCPIFSVSGDQIFENDEKFRINITIVSSEDSKSQTYLNKFVFESLRIIPVFSYVIWGFQKKVSLK